MRNSTSNSDGGQEHFEICGPPLVVERATRLQPAIVPRYLPPPQVLFQKCQYGGELVEDDIRAPGSNNWVIGGKYTASGKPLVSNDPHRHVTNPSLRYIFHLVAPGWNVIGSQEPPFVGVALGHNERIAWGLTITGTDQTDTFKVVLVAKANLDTADKAYNLIRAISPRKSWGCRDRYRNPSPRTRNSPYTDHTNPGRCR
jgi:acyl-homoserine lactone acylase PvdQ